MLHIADKLALRELISIANSHNPERLLVENLEQELAATLFIFKDYFLAFVYLIDCEVAEVLVTARGAHRNIEQLLVEWVAPCIRYYNVWPQDVEVVCPAVAL